MKKPYYKTKVKVSVGEPNNETVFPIGTLIEPLWNEDFIPEHLKEKLIEARKQDLKRDFYVLCRLGMRWVVMGKNEISEER